MSKLTVSLVLQTILPTNLYLQASNWQFFSASTAGILLVCCILLIAAARYNVSLQNFKALAGFGRFIYASFLKSHSGDGTGTGQQGALESFYKIQVCVLEICSKSKLISCFHRPMCTIPREICYFRVVRICLV